MSPKNFQSIRLPKGAPASVRTKFIIAVADSRSTMPRDKAIVSVTTQLNRVGVTKVPCKLVPVLEELVSPYVIKRLQTRKRVTPQV